MPTENRSSNTEMVSVPRQLLERLDLGKNTATALAALPELRAALALPAPQQQVEPVAVLYANGTVLTKADCGDVFDICCKVETPLYTHADPAEVERLRAEVAKFRSYCVDLDSEKRELEHKMDAYKGQAEESATLRAQLAEAHALLRRAANYATRMEPMPAKLLNQIDDVLSANAEPSAPLAPTLPELTEDLREILGRPNFTCHYIAKALRLMGLSIAPKSEDEQAVVIHWLLGHYFQHGADWRQQAEAELKAASEKLKA